MSERSDSHIDSSRLDIETNYHYWESVLASEGMPSELPETGGVMNTSSTAGRVGQVALEAVDMALPYEDVSQSEVPSTYGDPFEILSRRDEKEQTGTIVDALPLFTDREEYVLSARNPDTGSPITVKEIGRQLGVSDTRVMQIHNRAKRKANLRRDNELLKQRISEDDLLLMDSAVQRLLNRITRTIESRRAEGLKRPEELSGLLYLESYIDEFYKEVADLKAINHTRYLRLRLRKLRERGAPSDDEMAAIRYLENKLTPR